MSARASTLLSPAACSGDMYVGVPTDIPVPVRFAPSDSSDAVRAATSARATPKSASTACPSSSRMFSGLMSRCTIPLRCAYASASATSIRMRTASRTGSFPTLLEPVAQRLAAHVRHHVPEQIVAGARRRESARCADAAAARDLDLLLEARGAHFARELRRQHLDHDLPIERPLGRHEQPAHPAAAQLALEHVRVAERRL